MRHVAGELIALVGLLMALAPLAAEAQQTVAVHRIGVLLHDGAPPGLFETFREELRKLGYVEGKTVTFEFRDAAGKDDRLSALADQLLRLRVDVILAVNTPAALAAKKATQTIPIVMTRIADPVRTGLVPSLSRPGGNVTGLSVNTSDVGPKRIQLFLEIIPRISRVAILFNADNAGASDTATAMERASSQMGLTLLRLPVRGSSDLPGAFQAATRGRAQALIVLDDTLVTNHRRQIVDLAAKHSLPVGSAYKDFAEAGGLIAYGPNQPALYRRSAYYVDRILKGAKPGDLPVEEPTQFDLIINLKTAKVLGLTIPPSILLKADQVIE